MSSSNDVRAVSAELRVFGLKKKRKKETTDDRCPSPRPKRKSCRTRGAGSWETRYSAGTPGVELAGVRGHQYQNGFSTHSSVETGGGAGWPGEEQSETTTKGSVRWPGKPAPELGLQTRRRTLPDGRDVACAPLPQPRRAPVTSCVATGKLQGRVADIFPPGGMGGCFDISLPRGEVQRPNYIKCKPYVGSLTEQTHL